MSASQPPRLASWLLRHLASSPQRESLAGDLIERYHQGQSATWYWRQVLAAILAGVIRDIRDHKLLAMSWQGTTMDLHIKKVWLPGAASCLLFFGFYWILILLPFDKNRFQFISIPYLVLPFVGALGAYLSRRMNGSVVERIFAALFLVFTFVALFAVRIVYGLFFEGKPYTLPHFLSGLSVTLVFIIGVGGLLLVLGAWPFCRPHLREQSHK
jgi:hypothetical protein